MKLKARQGAMERFIEAILRIIQGLSKNHTKCTTFMKDNKFMQIQIYIIIIQLSLIAKYRKVR